MKQTIKLTESELRKMIVNAINESMEEGQDEIFDRTGKNLRAAWEGFKGYKGENEGNVFQNLGNRLRNGIEGYKDNNQWHHIDDLKRELKQMVDAGQLDARLTVGQLIRNASIKRAGRQGGNLDNAKATISNKRRVQGGQTIKESIDAVIDRVINEMIEK